MRPPQKNQWIPFVPRRQKKWLEKGHPFYSTKKYANFAHVWQAGKLHGGVGAVGRPVWIDHTVLEPAVRNAWKSPEVWNINPRKPKQSPGPQLWKDSLYNLLVKVARGVFQRCVETTFESIVRLKKFGANGIFWKLLIGLICLSDHLCAPSNQKHGIYKLEQSSWYLILIVGNLALTLI